MSRMKIDQEKLISSNKKLEKKVNVKTSNKKEDTNPIVSIRIFS